MLKWIKNSKSSVTNKTSKYRGIRLNRHKKYEASLILSRYNNKNKRIQTKFVIGSYNTEKEAVKERINYILNML